MSLSDSASSLSTSSFEPISTPAESTATPLSPIASFDSLPSSSDESESTISDSEAAARAEADAEWKESLQQLELLLTMVLVPYLGKYIGRKCAYWSWAKFMEWKYPVEVVVTSKAAFRGAGAVEAAASI